MLQQWRKFLLYIIVLATILKVWLPDEIPVSWPQWNRIVYQLIAVVQNQPVPANNEGLQTGVYRGRVVSVHDGDTLRIEDTQGRIHKIRLSNIDAPEIRQAYGTDSRDALTAQVYGQMVDINVINIDRYQREVGQILLQGQDINLWMLRHGYAWHYESIAKKQQNPLAYTQYQRAQLLAQQQRLGLWCQSHPVAPWQFRHHAKSQSIH
ncbi:thermonuclease family protein [Neisseriaceae bacterium ESL0693]|nr:thermonuclease family protein [Neisseriaceae bacterium ESL0693]